MRPGLPDPLIDLLGGRWALGAPAAGVAWFSAQVGFGLADGTVAIGRAGWEGAAEIRDREGGGVELVPASEAVPPMMRVGVHEGPCLAVAADADGLLTGGLDGRLALVAADGGVETLASLGQPINHVAVGHGRACAAGPEVRWFGSPEASLELPGPATALAFDDAGRQLAIGHAGGVTIWAAGEPARGLADGGSIGPLVWTPDGRHVVGNAGSGLTAWRIADGAAMELGAAAPSLSFSRPGGFLAASGAARVACWRLDGDGVPARRDCGVGSSAGVTQVACHPLRPLIAAGYENGAVLLCQPESTDILFVREAGGGAVAALAWSSDGLFLALAVAGGEVGIVAFPERLFRTGRPA